MKAGKLRHHVSIIRLVDTQSSSGESSPSPLVAGERFASVEPLLGRELIQAQQVQADVTHRIKMRGDSLTTTIKPKWKIKHQERALEILSVINKEDRGFEIELMCREEV